VPVARKRGRNPWSAAEEKILAQHYPLGSAEACLPLLPTRSLQSIQVHAAGLKIRVAVGRRPHRISKRKWQMTPEIASRLQEVYQRTPAGRDAAVVKLAREVGWPRHTLTQRAIDLGLVVPRFKEPKWSQLEVSILLMHRGQAFATLQRKLKERGFARTETAICIKCKRLEIGRDDPHHYSGTELAKLLGVDNKTVSTWLNDGLLYGLPRGTRRTPQQGGDEWKIARRDVRKFIIAQLERIDFRKLDKYWLVELLTDPTIA
jgi:hypothetical protein